MANGPGLRVRISADLNDIRKGLALLRTELAMVRRHAERNAPATERWAQGLQAVRKQPLDMVSLYGTIRAGGAYLRLADEGANLSGRLRLATKSQQEFNKVHRETFRIAQETSSEWSSIVGLFVQLQQSTGRANDEILELSKTISQSFTVSGSSVQDAQRGMVQLPQAIAGGTLRAQEFQTLTETNSRLVQALADELGIAAGKVRKYVNDGKVSSEILLSAIRNSARRIEEEYGRLPLTVGRATQQVRNALMKLVGDTDQAEGASRDLAEAISDLATFLGSDEARNGLAALITGLTTVARIAAEAAGGINRMGQQLRPLLADAERFLAMNANTSAAAARAAGRNPRDVLGVRAFLEPRFPWLYRDLFGGAGKPD